MERICIIGGCGTGKTTLADSLGKELNLPVFHIDGIHYLKNWEIRDKDKRDRIILEKIAEEKWIMDGTYTSTLEQRLERSDYIIYLDYSTMAQIRGVFGRFFKNHGKEKTEIPGCKEKMDIKFFLWVINWRKNKRNKIIESLQKIDSEKIHIFKTREKLNKWYQKEFGNRIIL